MAGKRRDDKPADDEPLPRVIRRDGGGLKPAGDLVPAILAPVFRKRGFAQHAIVGRWPEVVGPMLAEQCRPERLHWPRDESSDEGAVLHLVVSPGWATEVQHLAPLLIERVNRFFGWRAVTAIRIRQAPFPARRRPAPPPARPLTDAESRELDRLTAGIANRDVRDALRRLGATIFSHDDPGQRR